MNSWFSFKPSPTIRGLNLFCLNGIFSYWNQEVLIYWHSLALINSTTETNQFPKSSKWDLAQDWSFNTLLKCLWEWQDGLIFFSNIKLKLQQGCLIDCYREQSPLFIWRAQAEAMQVFHGVLRMCFNSIWHGAAAGGSRRVQSSWMSPFLTSV